MLTFDIFELHKSYIRVKWSEFHQKFNGHGPRQVVCLVWPLEVVFSLYEARKLTFGIFELQKIYLHVK